MLGSTISHYRILSKLGGGGMGVVYEAEDIRLKRHVALKFLPESLATNNKALQRMEREARAASSLNHPNICTIHDIEEYSGQPVIIMELLEGTTLKQRLEEGPLPISAALDAAIDICQGLCAAHSQGIIHRDIKPANIFIGSRGSAKILDFGLAKVTSHWAQADADLEISQQSLTETGVLPGTAAYMSPEQARGDDLDQRTDIFSVGVVLYEMVTGQRPFIRKNTILTLDAILNANAASPSSLNPDVPPELEDIIHRALEKKPECRYQQIADLCSDLKLLKQAKESGGTTAVGLPPMLAARPHPKRRWRILVPVGIVALVIGVGTFFFTHRARGLTEKDTIVLADFDNRTGDPVFDDTLKQALAVDLGQSPFLNIISDRKVAATLGLMGRAPDVPVTGEMAREVCQRVGSKAMLAGSISNLGTDYVIALNAVNCLTGDPLVKGQVEVRGKENVLKAVDSAATDMRKRLGESLASVQKSDIPIEEATTSSLEALKAYSTGRKIGSQKGNLVDLPFYQRAVELDPNFALAYRALAISYTNIGLVTMGRENAKKAFDLHQRVSERERYGIDAFYYSLVTGDLQKANQVYELWKRSYPRDFLPYGDLGDNYTKLGQWENALRETLDCTHLEPNSSVFNANLAQILLALNRTEEAKTLADQSQARGVDSPLLRLALYQAAFLLGEQETMQKQVAWATARLGAEDWLLSGESDKEAYFGHLRKAREMSRRAAESALRADEKETSAFWQANVALFEAEFGNSAGARRNTMLALALAPGAEVRTLAALALARAGDVGQARKLAEDLNKEFPEGTLFQGYWLPSINAAIEISLNKADAAIEDLQTAAPFELGQSLSFQVGTLYPVYLRGEAYLLRHDGKQAAAEFQKIIDHRGIVLNYPLGALAHLGLARAYALENESSKARDAYRDFLTLWKDADPDTPILRQAKAEYAKLR